MANRAAKTPSVRLRIERIDFLRNYILLLEGGGLDESIGGFHKTLKDVRAARRRIAKAMGNVVIVPYKGK